MSPFFRLLLGHLIGDFTLQTIGLVHYKSQSWKGLLLHAGIVAGATAVCLWGELPAWWPWVIVLFAWHILTDWGKVALSRRFPIRQLRLFLLDQSLHVGAIVGVVCLAQGGWAYPSLAAAIGGGSPEANRNLLFVAAFLIAFFVVPLLEVQVAYAMTRTANGSSSVNGPGASLHDRLWGGGERIIVLALLYLAISGVAVWAVALAPLAFVPRILAMRPLWRQPAPARMYRFKIVTSVSCMALLGVLLWVLNLLL